MAVESATHIADLNPSTIGVGTDPDEGGEQVNLVKTVLVTDLANINAAVTSSSADLNRCDVTTEGVAETSKVLTVSATDTLNAAILTWSNLGAVTTVDINGGSVDGTPIGASTASTGAFTNVTISGTLTASNGGAVDGITIGGTTPGAGTFTTLTANTSLVVNGSTALTSVDTDLSTVSAAHDTLTTAKAIDDHLTANYATQAYADARAFVVSNFVIDDVSTAETMYIPVGVTGVVSRVDTVLGGTISGADAGISLTTSSDQGMANITIANAGSGAGDVDSDATINNSSVTAGSYLKLSTDGASTGAVKVYVAITIDIS